VQRFARVKPCLARQASAQFGIVGRRERHVPTECAQIEPGSTDDKHAATAAFYRRHGAQRILVEAGGAIALARIEKLDEVVRNARALLG